MRNVFLSLAACFLLSVCPVRADSPSDPPAPSTTVLGDLVDRDAEQNEDLFQNAVRPFMALMKSYPHARRFRLAWWHFITMDGESVKVVYDRNRHTVTVGYIYGGGMDPAYEGSVQFTNVRESTFGQILQRHPYGARLDGTYARGDTDSRRLERMDVPHDSWGGFQFLFLPRYGCHAYKGKTRQMH